MQKPNTNLENDMIQAHIQMRRVDIELEALITEREAMIAANQDRQNRDESLAYNEESFFDLAARIRELL